MRRNAESLFSSLDRVSPRDQWEQIQDRAAEDEGPAIVDFESRGTTPAVRLVTVLLALAVFAGAASLTWSAFRSEPERSGNRPAAKNVTAPEIVPIADGYLLYSGTFGIPWELVAMPVANADTSVRPCGDGRLVVAYRDGESVDYQECPSPYFSSEVFTWDPSDGVGGALVVGTVATEVAWIGMETKDGRSVPGVTLPMDSVLDAGFNAFVIEVPSPFAGSIVAKSASGSVLQQQPVGVPVLP